MSFPLLAAALGIPVGAAAGWAVRRLILRWPAGHPDWPAGHPDRAAAHGGPVPGSRRRSGWRPRRRRWQWRARPIRGLTDPAGLAPVLLVTAGTVALGWSHPAADWVGWGQAVLLWILLVPIAWADLRSLIVDVHLVASGIALRILLLLLLQRPLLVEMMAGLLLAAGFFHILDLFYEALRGRKGLGSGDAAVAGLLGAFVGWQGVLPMVALAAVGGLAGGLLWLGATRRPISTPLPFAPFLCAAGFIVYLGRIHGWALWTAFANLP